MAFPHERPLSRFGVKGVESFRATPGVRLWTARRGAVSQEAQSAIMPANRDKEASSKPVSMSQRAMAEHPC
jgi:hypothetical protein